MTEKLHSILGASRARRWINCPGSVNAERVVAGEEEEQVSDYAIVGTAAHTLGENCLRTGEDTHLYVGSEIPVLKNGKYTYIEVDDEMAESVQLYLDYVRKRIRLAKARTQDWGVEEMFSLAELNPPEPMFGTSDTWIFDRKKRFLEVVDYKHGSGVIVEVEDNEQCMFYALGVVLKLKLTSTAKRPKTLRVTIVQPRAPHENGSIRAYEFDWTLLMNFKRLLLERARATVPVDAPRVAGDWCTYCRAAARCPEQRANAVAVAQAEFDVEPAFMPAIPELLSDEQVSFILSRADMMEGWLNAVRKYVSERLERGENFPGWKRVYKRANRKWIDADQAEAFLVKQLRKGGAYAPQKILSPAQAETALKKIGLALPEDLWDKTPSGTNLVPESDPRPAVLPSALTEFKALNSGE